MINAPINVTVGNMLKQVEIDATQPKLNQASLDKPVLSGGPVAEDRGFILHKPNGNYQSSISMTDQLSVTTSRDILTVLGTEDEPQHYLVALGYAGWEPGQLETELTENSWLTVEADPKVIFDTPIAERWKVAVQMLGINAAQLSAESGHA